MEKNKSKYYIIDSNDENLEKFLSISTGRSYTQRYSLDKSQLVIRLRKKLIKKYPFLDDYKSHGHKKILKLLDKPKWRIEDV